VLEKYCEGSRQNSNPSVLDENMMLLVQEKIEAARVQFEARAKDMLEANAR
jgi:hypothetical protein